MAKEEQHVAPMTPDMVDLSGLRTVTPVFANYFYLVVGPTFTRVTLGEQIFTEQPVFRSAVTMPTANAIQMAEKILGLAREAGLIRKEDGDKTT